MISRKVFLLAGGVVAALAVVATGLYKAESIKGEVQTQRNVLEKMSEYFYKKKAISAEMYESYLKGRDGEIDLTSAKPAYLSIYYSSKKDYRKRDDLMISGLASYTDAQMSNILEANLPIFDVNTQSKIIALTQMPSASATDIQKALNSTATYLNAQDINKLQRCYAIITTEKVSGDGFLYSIKSALGLHEVSKCSKI